MRHTRPHKHNLEKRRLTADRNRIARNKRTDKQQIKELKNRRGSSVREILRLQARIDAKNETAKK